MRTGWVFTRSARNNAHVHVLAALQAAVQTIPFEVVGLDFDSRTLTVFDGERGTALLSDANQGVLQHG